MRDDVPCVRFYDTIRKGAPQDALRLGVGRNLYAPSPVLLSWLEEEFRGLARSGRFATYVSDEDERDRELAAELLRRYLGNSSIAPSDVLFTNGAQEAISVACSYAARAGMTALFPLPLYYAFEQSSRRFGLPIGGHYRADGKIHWQGGPASRLFLVRVLPNGVTGAMFDEPEVEAELTLVDCVFQLGGFGAPGELAEHSRRAAACLDRSAMIFTLSKDLSLPGLRAGLLVSRKRELLAHASADRFERIYSVSPLVGRAVLFYLALLALDSGAATHDELAYVFRSAGVSLLAEEDARRVLAHFEAMTSHARRNLALVEREGRLLALDGPPAGGYSILPRVRAEFRDHEDFVAWVREVAAVDKLKLNPTFLFGGTREIWADLYPHEVHVRVNVSDDAEILALALDRLGVALGRRVI